jgi:hypothetical protein
MAQNGAQQAFVVNETSVVGNETLRIHHQAHARVRRIARTETSIRATRCQAAVREPRRIQSFGYRVGRDFLNDCGARACASLIIESVSELESERA